MARTNKRAENLEKWEAPILRHLQDRRPYLWGFADSTQATALAEIGDRIVPNRIDIEFLGTGEQPALRMRLEVVDGVPECRHLELDAGPDCRGVRSLDLDAVKLGQWVDDAFAEFALEVNPGNGVLSKMHGGWAADKQRMAAASEFQRARRTRVTPDKIRRAAEVYRAHFDDRPIEAVAKTFGISERTASDWIGRARAPELGYLPPTTRGKKSI